MRIKFTLQRSGAQPVDLAVTADAVATVGDLAAYLSTADPSLTSPRAEAGQLTMALVAGDTRALDPRATLADSGLRSGATATVTLAGSAYRDPQAGAVAIVTVVSGPDQGRQFPLQAGTSIVGRERGCEVRLSDTLVSRQHARINVTDVIEVVDLGSSNGLQVAGSVESRVVLRPGDTVTVGGTELSAALLVTPAPGAIAEGSNIAYIRSPRLDPIYPGVEFKAPEPPEPERLQAFPTLSIVASALMGVVLFAVTRSVYSLAFIVLSPILIIATSIEQRREAKASFAKAVEQFRADVADLVRDAQEAAQHEVFGRNRENPTAADCLEAVRRSSPLLWTRRPGEHGFTELRLGTGRQAARNTIKIEGSSRAPRHLQQELALAAAPFSTVDGVPIVARPQEHGAVGLAGQRATLLAAARAMILQAAALHSPAELVIGGVASKQSARDWDWLKWLPHTSSVHSPVGARHLASDGPAATALISELEDLVAQRTAAAQQRSAPSGPAILVLVEQDAPVEHSRLVELAEQGWQHGVHLLWLAGDLSRLPAACRTFVDLGTEREQGAAGFVHSSERVLPMIAETVDERTATEIARRLAPLVDIGARIADASDLPRSISLLSLTGTELAAAPEAVIEKWTENRSILTGPFAPAEPVRHQGSLRAVIGQSAGEPYAVDLRSDGPHALVGGTTGSGKSELLQAWILGMAAAHSPQRLSFLLVDYKGGSAFRDCVELPHTIGLVTDLSPHLVRRALTSLGAELRYREHVLAKHGAKDLATLEEQGVLDAPPSLVIVVDEFAALVSEVPEFVDGVVDVAQRGRSLGLHLILATQRPAGVIKENLRANTNLRVALRVADEDDSSDVLGSPEAAYFDRSIPGRAVSKTGPGRLVPFQAGYAGGRTTDTPPPPELVVEELTFGSGRLWAPSELPAPIDDTGPTDIQRLVASVRRATQLAELPAVRKAWLPELRHVYDLADQATVPSRRSDTELVFGISDDAEHQSQPPVAFFPDRDGNLAVYGTGGSGKSTFLRTMAIAAGFTVRGGPCHVYGLDFGARGLAMLEGLPHVGSIVAGSDDERVSRLLSWLRETIDARALRYSAVNAATITDYRRLAGAADEPRILLLVDGVAAFRQAYESLDRTRWFDMFLSIATEGRPVGVHVVLSSEQRSGLPTALTSAVQRRVVLRMSTVDDYGMLDVPADVLAASSPPGRGLIGEAEVQVAVLGGATDLLAESEAVTDFADAMRRAGASTAPPIQRLTDTVALRDLPVAADGDPVIGLSGVTLAPVTMPARGSFLIAGPSGSGRTTALLTVASALNRCDPQRRLYYFGQRRSPLAGQALWTRSYTGADDVAAGAAELADELGAPRPGDAGAAIFIENVGDFLDGEADLPLQDLARVCLAEEQLLVVDGETSALGSSYGLLGYAKASRSGLALQPEDTDGTLLYRTQFPRLARGAMPPGRALLVRLGKAELVQVALPGG
ncbi:MAG: hypothetical protein JWQ77_2999 [Jatrophihabitans sp.]|nr:hypothetical protein [Jatrophihabitans sp.]